MKRLFLLEDDLSLISGLSFAVKKRGYKIDAARTILEADTLWANGSYDLAILDVSLPDGSGFDFCRKIRRMSKVPVMFLTAADEETDIIMGLDIGGDDYITKPFNPSELVARVKSQLRRYTQLGAMQIKETQIAIRGLVLDTESKSVTVDGEAVRLTPLEYKILELLCRHPGRVFSTEEIYRQVWNDDIVSDNAIAVHVRHIREKIEINPKEPRYLKVVWGVGYKIERSE